MDPLSVQQAQKVLQEIEQCKNVRCVYDFFAKDVSRNSREDIYVFLKENGPARVQAPCSENEKPRRIKSQEVCYGVKLKNFEVQVLWRHEDGRWKLSNASKRKSSD